MSTYFKVVEVFQSIQGEGYYAGQRCNFIRLAPCNNHCKFCDTDLKHFTQISASEIRSRCVLELPVVLTGGEPLLYNDEQLQEISRAFLRKLRLETSGIRDIDSDIFEWSAVSPKKHVPCLGIRQAHEVKWLVPEWSLAEIQTIRAAIDCSAIKHYVQPVNHKTGLNFINIQKCLDYMAADPSLRLSLQIHKVLQCR